jgi:hypothetical protein
MGQLSEFYNNATNNYHLISRGQEPKDDEPAVVTKRFAENFQRDSKYAYWNVSDKNISQKYKKHIAESAQVSNLAYDPEYISKEILATKFKPIYGPEFKKLLWDAYINDYILGEATNIRSWSAFANQTQISLMPISNKVYESQEELTTALDSTGYNENERKKIIKFIETVEWNLGLEWYQQDLARQAMVGGVAALFLETFTEETRINDVTIPKGTPALIKPLHWSFLDQVKVDTATWKFESVHYTDFDNQYSNEGPTYIPARQLLYVTRNDNGVTPNNLYYGISDYHPILKLSNIIRQAEEVDFPEIVTSFWCQPGILKFKNMNTDEMDKFMSQIGPGLLRGFNSQVDFEPVNVKHDGWFLITLLETVIRHMLMKMRIPEFMYAFGGSKSSRADVEIQMNAYDKLVLSNERWWMGHHLRTQLYDYLLALVTKEPDPTRQKFRVVQNFMPWSFEDILAKANSLELLVRRYFITLQEGRQFLGMKPYNSEISDRVNPIGQLKDLPPIDKIKFKQQQELQQQRMDQQQKTMDQFASNNPNQNPIGQKGFQPPSERQNAKNVSVAGAGRGNKT